MIGVLIKKGNLDTETRQTQREGDVERHREKVALYEPRRESWDLLSLSESCGILTASERINPANTLMLDY